MSLKAGGGGWVIRNQRRKKCFMVSFMADNFAVKTFKIVIMLSNWMEL